MLPGNVTTPAFAPLRPLALQAGRIAAAALSDTDKARLAEQVRAAETLRSSAKTARDEARSQVKNRARETIQRLHEEFKLIRKQGAHNPKEMARQLARIAKDLKRALADHARREVALPPRCAASGGYNLHAGVAFGAKERRGLERLCRYVLRPPLAQDRFQPRGEGMDLLHFKRVWSDGTGGVVLSALEVVERLVR